MGVFNYTAGQAARMLGAEAVFKEGVLGKEVKGKFETYYTPYLFGATFVFRFNPDGRGRGEERWGRQGRRAGQEVAVEVPECAA
eukprot:5906752-Lingulodinium_polyedra.AAC.1